MANTGKRASVKPTKPSAITRLEIAGYKSISAAQSLEIRPLTILAGANSSGKSSVMQPLLLLKQTLAEASDPGAILLDGPNVKSTSAKQMLCKCRTNACRNGFAVGIEVDSDTKVTTRYVMADGGFRIESMEYQAPGNPKMVLKERMSHEEILQQFPDLSTYYPSRHFPSIKWKVVRNRCFLELVFVEGE